VSTLTSTFYIVDEKNKSLSWCNSCLSSTYLSTEKGCISYLWVSKWFRSTNGYFTVRVRNILAIYASISSIGLQVTSDVLLSHLAIFIYQFICSHSSSSAQNATPIGVKSEVLKQKLYLRFNLYSPFTGSYSNPWICSSNSYWFSYPLVLS